jgi:hypothetical protein
MAKKKRAGKRQASARRAKKKRTARKKPAAIAIRRSSGRKERFDLDRLAKTAGRSGIPFMMARDIAKNISNKIKSESRGKIKKTVTAGRMRKMIADELRSRNQQAIASSYAGEMPDTQQDVAPKVKPHESPIGSADKDQHSAYRVDRDSVMHDRSKRLASSA